MNENNDKSKHDIDQPSWFERNVSLLIGLLIAVCMGSLAAEFACNFLGLSPFVDEHHPAHFPLENVFGYQAVIGFVAFICVIYLGKILRLIIRREEDYYDQ